MRGSGNLRRIETELVPETLLFRHSLSDSFAMFLLRVVAPTAFFLSLAALPASHLFAGSVPAPGEVPVETLVKRLTFAVRLRPTQLPAVRIATGHYAKRVDSLKHMRFASVAASSAAFTVVEYRYYRALQEVLTPAQMVAYEQLDAQPSNQSE